MNFLTPRQEPHRTQFGQRSVGKHPQGVTAALQRKIVQVAQLVHRRHQIEVAFDVLGQFCE